MGPFTALLAASGAAIPSSSPSPKVSGCVDARFAAEYPTNAATTCPTQGTIPIPVPMPVERSIVLIEDLNSFHLSFSPVLL